MARPDTTPEAEEVQSEIWRRMSGSHRVRLAESMSEDARRVARAGIKARQPGLSEDEVTFELIRLMYGVDLTGRGRRSEA